MRRWPCVLLLFAAVAPPAAAQGNEQLAVRCSQLGALYDRQVGRRSEGSGGPNMTRLGAGVDCDKGRYEQGIKALEDLLRRNRIEFPS